MNADRILGLLVFLPVPIVLWLYTRQPLGVVPSLVVGSLIMLSHPLYARPFSLRRAARRCLWCGAGLRDPDGTAREIRLLEPRGATVWKACSGTHLENVHRVLAWAQKHAVFLRAGILGALGIFLLAAVAAEFRWLGPATSADTIAFFRLGVAVTVLPLGWLGPIFRGTRADPLRTPFPVHIQALVGTAAVIWLFRLIGLLWLAQGVLHFARRVG